MRFNAAAVDRVIDRVRRYLAEHEYDDFNSADQFADDIVRTLEAEYKLAWSGRQARAAIRGIVRSTYEFYRLRDATPFGDASPVRVRFGGPDQAAMEFLDKLDHFYFSKFTPNTGEQLRKVFRREFFENGAALFGRGNAEQWQRFREAFGTRAKNLTDKQVETIATTAVQRTRNWAHIETLHKAGFEYAEIVAVLDNRTTEICRGLNGKFIRVGVAHKAVQRLSKLQPGEFAYEMYETPIGKAISKEPTKTISKFVDVYKNADGERFRIIADSLVAMGRGFPPYHPNCRTRMKAVYGVNTDFTELPVHSQADDVENMLTEAGYGLEKRIDHDEQTVYLLFRGQNGRERVRISDHDSRRAKPSKFDYRPGDDLKDLIGKVEKKVGKP